MSWWQTDWDHPTTYGHPTSPDNPYLMGGVELTPEEAKINRLEETIGQMAWENSTLQEMVNRLNDRLHDQSREMAATHTRSLKLEEQVLANPTAEALDKAIDRYNEVSWWAYDRDVRKHREPYYENMCKLLREKVAELQAATPPCDPKWMAKKIRGQRKEIVRLEKELAAYRKEMGEKLSKLYRENYQLDIKLRALTPTACP